MLTIRQAVAGTTGVLVVALMASTASAENRRNHRGSHDDGDARAFAGPVCEVSDGHLQFVNGRSPFRGNAQGSYGGIFFAGGGTTLPTGSNRSSTTNGASGNAAAPVTSPGNGGGGSAGAPAHGGTGSNAGSPTVTSPTVTAPTVSTPTTTPAVIGDGDADHDDPIAGNPGGGNGNPISAPGLVHTPVAGPKAVAVNPEPTSLLLIGTGLGSVLIARRRQRKPRG